MLTSDPLLKIVDQVLPIISQRHLVLRVFEQPFDGRRLPAPFVASDQNNGRDFLLIGILELFF